MPVDIYDWRVEDDDFWKNTGKRIATRNLWISWPALFCGFAIWIMWSMITLQMVNFGFPYSEAELFSLPAIAGFSGATLRISSSFMIRMCGGRNTIWFTTALLMIPALGAGIFLRYPDTPLPVFQLIALLSGIGGGNFASSMSNLSSFYPKRIQGTVLGLNAGLGNLGVSAMQLLVPLTTTISFSNLLGGPSRKLIGDSGALTGGIPAGGTNHIHYAGLVWMIFLVPLFFVTLFKMNNIKTDSISPDIGGLSGSAWKMTYLLGIGLITAAVGLYLMLHPPIGLGISKYIVLPAAIGATVLLMRYATPAAIRRSMSHQYRIFYDPVMGKHTWAMTIIYSMTFGSFIGYSQTFPLAIKVIFGFKHLMDPATGLLKHDIQNPAGPNPIQYAWIASLVGSIMRPVGGWIADKAGGALVTGIISIIMAVSAVFVGFFMKLAYVSPTPEQYFRIFFIMFLILFAASGMGNGSAFRTIGAAFNEEQAGPALGWTSGVAAFGAFMIPIIFAEQIEAGRPEIAHYGFALFYAFCFLLNYWFYLRPNAYIKNP